MKTVNLGHQRHSYGLTLTEILAVIVVLFILAALLMPLNSDRRRPPVLRVRIEEADLVNALNAYYTEYGSWPIPDLSTNEDVTCGATPEDLHSSTNTPGVRWIVSNADLMIVLMDFDYGVNASHKRNPKMTRFLNARVNEGTNSPGVSLIDYQYRDPWGHPYIISLDANNDGFTRDGFYANPDLYADRPSAPFVTNNGCCELPGHVMVWSLGKDGKASPSAKANEGANRDNVTSWQ